MGKNLSFKKIGKQILSINNLIESYFNKLRSFISNPKKFQFTRDNRVIFVFAGIVFLTLAYFLVPTAYNKDLIQKEIKNQLFLTYKIRIEFSDEINYGLFPKPHFVAKNLSILNDCPAANKYIFVISFPSIGLKTTGEVKTASSAMIFSSLSRSWLLKIVCQESIYFFAVNELPFYQSIRHFIF